MKTLASAFALLALLALLGALLFPGDAEAKSSSHVHQGIPAKAAPGTLLRYDKIGMPRNYRATAWHILYVTRDYQNHPILSTGIVVLPDKAVKSGARKYVAWAHPTTGVAWKCAPSLRASPVRSIGGLNDLVANGFIVAATDYPGLGTEGPVGYLAGRGQAYATLDSVRAAMQIPGVGGGKDYALWGYSQGGHAALFAAELARSYMPELSLKGVAVIAPPTDLAALLRLNLGTVSGRILAAFTLSSWHLKYGASLAPLLDTPSEALVREVGKSCVDDLGGQLDALAAQKALDRNFLKDDPSDVTPWSSLLVQNSLFGFSAQVPALVIQGSADDLVRPAVTAQFVRTACHDGARVEYVTLKGKGHGGAMDAGAKLAIRWIAARLAGQPARSNCR